DHVRAGDVPEPELREDDVLVEVHAAGVNMLDSRPATRSTRGHRPRMPTTPLDSNHVPYQYLEIAAADVDDRRVVEGRRSRSRHQQANPWQLTGAEIRFGAHDTSVTDSRQHECDTNREQDRTPRIGENGR